MESPDSVAQAERETEKDDEAPGPLPGPGIYRKEIMRAKTCGPGRLHCNRGFTGGLTHAYSVFGDSLTRLTGPEANFVGWVMSADGVLSPQDDGEGESSLASPTSTAREVESDEDLGLEPSDMSRRGSYGSRLLISGEDSERDVRPVEQPAERKSEEPFYAFRVNRASLESALSSLSSLSAPPSDDEEVWVVHSPKGDLLVRSNEEFHRSYEARDGSQGHEFMEKIASRPQSPDASASHVGIITSTEILKLNGVVGNAYASAPFHKHNISLREAGFREILQHSEALEKLILYDFSKMIDDWNIDMFEVASITGDCPIVALSSQVFTKLDLYSKLNLNEIVCTNFFREVERAYFQNPYHNSLHGADVMVSVYNLITKTTLATKLTDVEMFALIVAGASHDVAHPGTNNIFQIKSGAAVALEYNDVSVLENFHCSMTFKLMSRPDLNILKRLRSDKRSTARKIMISAILATDMANHAFHLGQFKSTIGRDVSPFTFEERLMVFNAIMKCADLAHASKVRRLHVKWTKLCMQEFMDQAEKEKAYGIPVSIKVDSSLEGYAKSQIGFVQPLFSAFSAFTEDSVWESRVAENLHFWQNCSKTGRSDIPLTVKRNSFKLVAPPDFEYIQSGPGRRRVRRQPSAPAVRRQPSIRSAQ